ncbi:hypothetical protein SHKM778_47630 [Streptomyces sp. KM77-8]|uniref:Uncharacterized protein n=1 Tax=Streptomyces haneummycinicus TaxID=3074435 RepID=A0AAT9HLP8_9ACTN
MYFGLAEQLREMRADVLQAVYAKHPERFAGRPPEPPKAPAAAWINAPAPDGPLVPAQCEDGLPALIALTGSAIRCAAVRPRGTSISGSAGQRGRLRPAARARRRGTRDA